MTTKLSVLLFGLQATMISLLPPLYDLRRLERFCKRKLRSNPSAIAPRIYLANLYFDHRQFAQAKSEFEILLRTEQSDLAIRRDLGLACYEIGDYESAARHLSVVLDRKSDFDVASHLGLSLMYIEEFQQATVALTRAETLVPSSTAVLQSLGYCYFRLGQFELAVEKYWKALELCPGSEELRDNAARARAAFANQLISVERKPEARAVLESALSIHPSSALTIEISRVLNALAHDDS